MALHRREYKPRLDTKLLKKNRGPRVKFPSSDYEYESSRASEYQVTHVNNETGVLTVEPWLQYFGPTVTSGGKQVTLSINTDGWPRVRVKPDHPFHRSREFRSDPKSTSAGSDWIRREDIVQDYQGAVWQHVVYDGTAESFGCRMTKGVPADDPYPRLVNLLLSRLQSAKANTAVAMAELGKTAAHVAKTARKLGNAYLALKHLKFGNFARELGLVETAEKDIRKKYLASSRKSLLTYGATRKAHNSHITAFAAETWLEYSYAWKPLLKDVYDHADALAQTVVERSGVMREAKAKVKTSRTVTEDTPGSDIWDYSYTSSDQNWQAMEVRYRVPQGVMPAVRAFGLVNPLEVAWELVPFSFVVDWFIPIGDAIRNLTATVGLTFHSGWKTTRVRHDVTTRVFAHGRRVTSGSLRIVGYGSKTANLWWFEIHRTIVTEFPTPSLPQWKDPRSIAHGLSAIALLKTIFLGGDKKVRQNLR
jgi:hypothetical protein